MNLRSSSKRDASARLPCRGAAYLSGAATRSHRRRRSRRSALTRSLPRPQSTRSRRPSRTEMASLPESPVTRSLPRPPLTPVAAGVATHAVVARAARHPVVARVAEHAVPTRAAVDPVVAAVAVQAVVAAAAPQAVVAAQGADDVAERRPRQVVPGLRSPASGWSSDPGWGAAGRADRSRCCRRSSRRRPRSRRRRCGRWCPPRPGTPRRSPCGWRGSSAEWSSRGCRLLVLVLGGIDVVVVGTSVSEATLSPV